MSLDSLQRSMGCNADYMDHTGDGYFFTWALTNSSYFLLLCVKSMYASLCAGDFSLGESSKSCIPINICFSVIDGLHCSSSLRILRHTVPDG